MGCAPRMEDIVARHNLALDRLASALEDPHPTRALRDEAMRALADARALLAQVQRQWDMATAPQLDLALEIDQLGRAIDDLRGQVELAEQDRQRAEEELSKARHDLTNAKQQVRELMQKNQELETRFDELRFADQIRLFPPSPTRH